MPVLRKGLCPLLTKEVIEKCKRIGVKSVYDFLSSDPELLCLRCDISYKDVISINNVLQAQFSAFPQNASDVYNEIISTLAIFSTGCSRLDELLDGGIYTGEIIEIVGPPAAGKTQLCHSLLTKVSLETHHSILYIDTGGSFSCHRIQAMLKSREISDTEISEILQRIHCVSTHDIFELMKILEEIKSLLCSQVPSKFTSLKLIILDSVTALLSPHLGDQVVEGLGLMVHLAHLLKNICSDHALAVVICNNTVQGEGIAYKPALGRYWQHVPSVTLQIEKRNPNGPVGLASRKVTVIKSCRQFTPMSTIVKITEAGIENDDSTS